MNVSDDFPLNLWPTSVVRRDSRGREVRYELTKRDNFVGIAFYLSSEKESLTITCDDLDPFFPGSGTLHEDSNVTLCYKFRDGTEHQFCGGRRIM